MWIGKLRVTTNENAWMVKCSHTPYYLYIGDSCFTSHSLLVIYNCILSEHVLNTVTYTLLTMAYIVLGDGEDISSESICSKLMSLSGEDTLLYCCLTAASTEADVAAQWVEVGDAVERSLFCTRCGVEDVHTALDTLAILHRGVTPTIMWYLQPHHSEDVELLGALLRASRCLNSRILVISSDADVEQRLNNLWISDYISPVIVPDIDRVTLPCWRGQLIMGEDKHVYVEIVDSELMDCSQRVNKTGILEGAAMELVSEVDLSSIHACMLGDMYTLRLSTTTDLVQHSLHSGYIVRMVIPQQASTAPSLPVPVAAPAPQSIKAEEITSTEQWLAYVLKEKLTNPEIMPTGPVYYKYYLFYSANPDSVDATYICSEFDTDDLTSLLLSVNGCSCKPEENTMSNYNQLRDEPLSPSSLFAETQQIYRIINSLLYEDNVHVLNDCKSWNEWQALENCTKRHLTLLRADDSADSKGADSSNSGCILTLDSVRNNFTKAGVAIDPKYHLKTGNFEMEGLRQHKWPLATLHYGPGICYHTEDDVSKRADPRLAMYRTKHGFPETCSLHTTDVMTSNHTTLPSKKQLSTSSAPTNVKSLDSTKAVKRCRSSPRKAVPALQCHESNTVTSKRGKVTSKTQQQVTSKTQQQVTSKTQQQVTSQTQQKVTAKAPQLQTSKMSGTSDGAYSSTREERAQRNKRNVQKMERAVSKALAKRGIRSSHNLYDAYKKELFDLSMRGVKELKTSYGLENKMKEIAEVYAPAAVLTVDMKNK